jgi:hypothetical protein
MGDEQRFSISSFVLDVYCEQPPDGDHLLAALHKHFAPVQPDETPLSPFQPEQESVVMAAADPNSFLDELERLSPQSGSFRHIRKYFQCSAANLQILRAKEWPFGVAHISFILQVPGEDTSKKNDIHGLVLATVQDLYYALIDAYRSDLGDLASAAVATMVVDVSTIQLGEIRGAWEGATRGSPGQEEQEASPTLLDVLGPDWQFGDIGSMSHMAQGTNLHSVVSPLHSTATPVRQAFSVTFQDAAQKSFRSGNLSQSPQVPWWGAAELLSPRRSAYYRPRSFELGMLLLFDQWTHRRLERLRTKQNTALDNMARVRPRLRAFDVLMPWKGRGPVMDLRREALSNEAAVQRGMAIGAGPLSSVLNDASIYGGIEVPAYRYPTARFGQQQSTQGGFIFGMAERTATRLKSLKEAARELVEIASEEVALQVSESQEILTRAMAWLTVVIALLTAALVLREFIA